MLRRNVLILHSGALGDFVLTWPLILALGRTQPQSRIIAVTQASKGKLAEAALRVESADIESGWQGLFIEASNPTGAAEKLARAAKEIYSFISAAGDVATMNLTRWSNGADVIPIPPRPPADCKLHAAEYIAEQVKDRPVTGVGVRQMLASISDRGLGFGGSSGDVVVHPGSGSETKNWPRPRFLELAKKLRAGGRTVRLIVGEVEQEKWAQGEIAAFADVAQVTTPASYVELFEEYKSAGLVIANDSGPGHLAGVMGIPTLSLFGPSDPNVWRPLGPRVKILHREKLDQLAVQDVYDAAVGMQKGVT